MLIPSAAWEALLEAGVQLGASDSGHVDFWVSDDSGKRRAHARVKSWSSPVGPAQVRRLRESVGAGEHLVLIAPAVSAATQDALTAEGWSWIAIPRDGSRATGLLRLPDWEAIVIGGDQQKAGAVRHARTGRIPWGTFTAIRNLLTQGGSWSQTELSRVSSISQPRASQILSELRRDGLVERTHQPGDQHRRWQVTSWDDLLDRWLETYPGPGGVTTYWLGLNAITEQAGQVVDALVAERQDSHPGPVVSGDAAAEFIAPYRRPQRAVVYSRWGADLKDAGLTPIGPDEATLELIVPEDGSVWPRFDARTEDLPLKAPFRIADPIQVIWDLQRAPGMDSDQAADAVRDVVRDHVTRAAGK